MGTCCSQPTKAEENDVDLKSLPKKKSKKTHNKKHAKNNRKSSQISSQSSQSRYVINKKRKPPPNSHNSSLTTFDLNESLTVKKVSKSNSNISNRTLTNVSKKSLNVDNLPIKYDPVNKFNKNAYIALFDYVARTTEDLNFKKGKIHSVSLLKK